MSKNSTKKNTKNQVTSNSRRIIIEDDEGTKNNQGVHYSTRSNATNSNKNTITSNNANSSTSTNNMNLNPDASNTSSNTNSNKSFISNNNFNIQDDSTFSYDFNLGQFKETALCFEFKEKTEVPNFNEFINNLKNDPRA